MTVFGPTQPRQAKDETLLQPPYSWQVIERTRLTIHHKAIAQPEIVTLATMNQQAEDILKVCLPILTLDGLEFQSIHQMCRKAEAFCIASVCHHAGTKERSGTRIVVYLNALTVTDT